MVDGHYRHLSCAGVAHELQVGIAQNGELWHTIRHSDGSWQSSFGLIQGQESNDAGPFTRIGCAGVGDELQLVGIARGQLATRSDTATARGSPRSASSRAKSATTQARLRSSAASASAQISMSSQPTPVASFGTRFETRRARGSRLSGLSRAKRATIQGRSPKFDALE